MPTIYAHEKPNNRMLNFAAGRRQEIAKAMEQLKLEDELMVQIIDKFKTLVCARCGGAGNYMAPIKGCECDGPRQHACEVCKGSGKPSNAGDKL